MARNLLRQTRNHLFVTQDQKPSAPNQEPSAPNQKPSPCDTGSGTFCPKPGTFSLSHRTRNLLRQTRNLLLVTQDQKPSSHNPSLLTGLCLCQTRTEMQVVTKKPKGVVEDHIAKLEKMVAKMNKVLANHKRYLEDLNKKEATFTDLMAPSVTGDVHPLVCIKTRPTSQDYKPKRAIMAREPYETMMKNIIAAETGEILYYHCYDYSTSANTLLLEHLDSSETMGKVSFLPIEFCRDYVKNHLLKEVDSQTFETELKEKEYLVSHLETLDRDELLKARYKNVSVHHLRKPYLMSSLSATKNHIMVNRTINESLYVKIGFDYQDIAKCSELQKVNTHEWMYLDQLEDFFRGWCDVSDDVELLTTFTDHVTPDFVSNKRFLVGIILQNYHFTCYLVDQECRSGTQKKRRNIYFFDSVGYKDAHHPHVSTIIVDRNHQIKAANRGQFCEMDPTLVSNINKMSAAMHVDNVVLNSFCVQNMNSECGGFVSLFLLTCLQNILASTYDKDGSGFNFRNMSYCYHTLGSLGFDFTVSMIKGVAMFMTKEDLDANKITLETYEKSLRLYKVSNHKVDQFTYLKNLAFSRLMEIVVNLCDSTAV